MKSIVSKLYQNKLLKKLMPTMVYCLENELMDCESVLDLGCGPNSPVQHCENIKTSVGVEIFEPYLIETQKKSIHTKYENKLIKDLKYDDNSFDAVLLLEVLEHMTKKEGEDVIRFAHRVARKKIIISCPNGYYPQNEVDKNPYQAHKSGWNFEDFKKMGFKVKGLAGLKFLRKESDSDSMDDNILASVRYSPKILWFIIISLSQMIVYHVPKLSFGLFCVKKLDG